MRRKTFKNPQPEISTIAIETLFVCYYSVYLLGIKCRETLKCERWSRAVATTGIANKHQLIYSLLITDLALSSFVSAGRNSYLVSEPIKSSALSVVFYSKWVITDITCVSPMHLLRRIQLQYKISVTEMYVSN